MFHQAPCSQLQKFVNVIASEKAEYCEDLSELLLIQGQTDLIHEIIKNQNCTKKYNTLSTEHSDFLLQVPTNPHHFNISFSGIEFSKQPPHFFQQQSLQQALKEIHKLCSRKTYNFVRDKFKIAQQNRAQTKLQKEIKHNKELIKHNQQLMKRCLKLDSQVKDLKIKLQNALKNQVANKNTKVGNINLEKSQIYLKWEKSLVFKEKSYEKMKKNLSNQLNALQDEKKINELIRQELQNMIIRFQQIEPKHDNNQIKQIFEKINHSIDEQRKLSIKQNEDYKEISSQIDSTVQQLKNIIGILQ